MIDSKTNSERKKIQVRIKIVSKKERKLKWKTREKKREKLDSFSNKFRESVK